MNKNTIDERKKTDIGTGVRAQMSKYFKHTLKRKCRHFDEIFITGCTGSCHFDNFIRLEGPEDPHLTNSRFLRSRDPAHASLPLAQTPWGLTGRAWLQAGAQQEAIVVSHH